MRIFIFFFLNSNHSDFPTTEEKNYLWCLYARLLVESLDLNGVNKGLVHKWRSTFKGGGVWSCHDTLYKKIGLSEKPHFMVNVTCEWPPKSLFTLTFLLNSAISAKRSWSGPLLFKSITSLFSWSISSCALFSWL